MRLTKGQLEKRVLDMEDEQAYYRVKAAACSNPSLKSELDGIATGVGLALDLLISGKRRARYEKEGG